MMAISYSFLFFLFFAILLKSLLGVLVFHFYTLYRLRNSRLLPGAIPFLGHLNALIAAEKANHDDLTLALLSLMRDVPGGACTMLLGSQAVTLIKDPEVLRTVLSCTVFNHRPQSPKWEIFSLVRRADFQA